ncbi:MAG: polysaccharide deacetylase family protein [Candidatus Saccharibacteria bacterium]
MGRFLKWTAGIIAVLVLISLVFLQVDKRLPDDSELGKIMFLVRTNFNPKLITTADTHGKKLVALTFDDGPDPRFTPKVLDILKKYNIKATFFVVGQSAEKHPDLIKRQISEGHEIENHTYTHPDLEKDSGFRIDEEILKCQFIIENLTNRRPIYFRPPKKLFNQEVIDLAELNGYQTILWSIGVEHRASKTVKDMAQRVIDDRHPGMIILAHDGRLDRTRTVESLPFIIDALQKDGYKFITLEELTKNSVK